MSNKKHSFNNYWCRLYTGCDTQYKIFQTTTYSAKKHLKAEVDNGELANRCTVSRANGTILSECFYDETSQEYFY